jgi:hypothetical protein
MQLAGIVHLHRDLEGVVDPDVLLVDRDGIVLGQLQIFLNVATAKGSYMEPS